jgi:hypothetical protein
MVMVGPMITAMRTCVVCVHDAMHDARDSRVQLPLTRADHRD